MLNRLKNRISAFIDKILVALHLKAKPVNNGSVDTTR